MIEYGDCKECKHNIDCPHKPKSLAQYLTGYIGKAVVAEPNFWRGLIEQALDAYESTEQVKIRIERI